MFSITGSEKDKVDLRFYFDEWNLLISAKDMTCLYFMKDIFAFDDMLFI